ncbi:hypothetical protein GF348_08620, partial [candidate division KSB3 bacterium]|nr:hypothetical protein [candidate division KSB3 bacterium]
MVCLKSFHRNLRFGLVLILFVLPLIMAVPLTTSGENALAATLADEVVTLTNAARSEEGLLPLVVDERLTAAAQAHSQAMADSDFFDHIDPVSDTDPAARIAATGYEAIAVAENIAVGQPSPEKVVEGWLNSPEHRVNIMDPTLEEIGVGYVYEEDDVFPNEESPYQHYWTQNFGTRQDSTITATTVPTGTVTTVPTGTLSLTPVATPLPTFTPPPTPTAFVSAEITEDTPSLVWWRCFPWWLLVPLLLLLLLWLLLFLTSLGDRLRDHFEQKTWLCKLLSLLTLLYLLFLSALIAKALLANMCQIERVFFWRTDGRSAGIYSTDFGIGGEPSSFDPVNDESECVACHAVSPTSYRLVGSLNAANGRVAIRGLNGEEVVIPDINASYMSWSPDGDRLAISLNDEDIYILGITSGDLEPLAGASEPDQVEAMPSWSPDGQSIAFVRALDSSEYGFDIDSPTDIYVVPATGGTAVPLEGASGVGFNYYPAYSPDGQWLAFTHHRTGSTTYADRAADIYLVPATGGKATLLAASSPTASDSWPTWSAGGQWLAFATNRLNDQFDIFVTQIDEVGASGPGAPLPGADASGYSEHLACFAPPVPLPPLGARLLALWPWLIPLILLLFFLWLACRKTRPIAESPVESEPLPEPRRPLNPPDFLEAWAPEPIWEPIPTLVIGAGGTGRHVLTQIKKNLRDAGAGRKEDQVRLLLLDTSDYELMAGERVPVHFAGVELDSETEVVEFGEHLGPVVRAMRTQAETEPELQDWFPAGIYARTLSGDALDLSKGTQGRRPPVRAALVRDVRRDTDKTDAASKLWNLLGESVTDVIDGGRVRIVLIGSLAGGTGSAVIADLAYLARRAASEVAKAEGTALRAYLVTDAAFARVATQSNILAANTFAALRELERFQLAHGRPFRMTYDRTATGDPVLNGLVDSRLLDEIYLFDGHRADRPLGNELPWMGVFASIADVVTLWLDKKSWQQDIGQHRSNLQGLANREQRKQSRIVVGGSGSFAFRLPMFDIVEQLKVRYARELIRLMLIGEEEGELRLDPGLNREEALGHAEDLARQFLLGRAGYSGCPRTVSFLGQMASKGWTEVESDFSSLLIGSEEKERKVFRQYLLQALQTVLNGQESTGIATARSGKIAYGLVFLDSIDQILYHAEKEVKYIQPEEDVLADAYENLERLPKAYREEIDSITEELRQQAELISVRLCERDNPPSFREAGQGAQAVYEMLLEREEKLRQWSDQMDQVLVRQYISGLQLVESWYKTYLDDPDARAKALRRLYWQSDSEKGVQLALRTQEDHILIAEEGGAEQFMQALLEFAGYQARQIWERETLATALAYSALHPEEIDTTADTLWQNSGPLLRYDPFKASEAVESAIFGVNYKVKEMAEPLAQNLQMRLPADRKLMALDITDPYTLLLVQTVDVIPLKALPAVSEAERSYRVLYGLVPGGEPDPEAWPTAVFAAEYTALGLEQRMGAELRQAARVLHPAVVTGLNEPGRARV